MRQKQNSKDLEEFLSDWGWVVKVINSCITITQLNNANKLRFLLEKKYNKRVIPEYIREARRSLTNRYFNQYVNIRSA